MSVTLTCPQCGFVVEDPRAEAASDSTLATCHKCRAKSLLRQWRSVGTREAAIPPSPPPVAVSNSAPVAVAEPSVPSPSDDAFTISALSVVVIALLAVNVSFFFNWTETALGGTLGIAGHGAILLGGSIVALVVVAAAALMNQWRVPLLLLSQGWTLLIATWCIILFRRISAFTYEEVPGQLFFMPAVAASAVPEPGAGLYLALFGSIVACIATATVCGRRLLPTSLFKFGVAQIGVSVISVGLALLLIPAQERIVDVRPASVYEQLTANMPTHPSAAPPGADAPLFAMGMSYVLGNLEITPKEFASEILQESKLFGEPKPRNVTSVVFTFTAKNISKGQVFSPGSKMIVVDEHGNRCLDPLDRQLMSNSISLDQRGNYTTLQPGETATVKLVFDPAFEDAKEYTCEVTTAASNTFDLKRWRVVYRPEAASP